MDELLKRYTPEQQKIINDFWEVVRWTRQTGKISDGIKRTEMEYWKQFNTDIVIRALELHIDSAPNIKEHYTRGIMRNLDMEKSAGIRKNRASKAASAPPKQSRFNNFTQSSTDYDALNYIETLNNSGELTEAKREELKADPRYAKYL